MRWCVRILGGDGFPSTTSANNLIAKRQLATPPVYEQEVVRCAKTSRSASLSPNSSNSTRTIAACHIAYLACGNLKCVLLLRVEPFCTCEAEQKKEDEDCYLNFHFKIYYHENQILFFGSCWWPWLRLSWLNWSWARSFHLPKWTFRMNCRQPTSRSHQKHNDAISTRFSNRN
jgi:hypothetical protein